MVVYRQITNKIDNLDDLKVWVVGQEAVTPGKKFGPAIRDHYLLHFVKKGQGTFINNGRTFHITAGQIFLITPETIHYYAPMDHDPWSYIWVGFHGTKADYYLSLAGLSTDSPIYHPKHVDRIALCFDRLIQCLTIPTGAIKDLRQLTCLYDLFSTMASTEYETSLLKNKSNQEVYIKTVIDFIYKHFPLKISISEIAEKIGLNPSYLGSIFKKQLGMSPQQFLIQVRMDKACQFMKHPDLTISDIARSVGYDDPLHFSRMFRKLKGMSPSDYRSKHNNVD